jgi:histidinol phosphatase-like PHP family hydrolase
VKSNDAWVRQYLGGLAHVHTRLSNYHGHRESDQSVQSYVSWLTAQGLLGPDAPWQYLVITNHTANPVRPWRLGLHGWRLRQLRHQALQTAVDDIPVWQGFECSLLPDGRTDMPEPLRTRAAVVVASVHGGWSAQFSDGPSRLAALEQACNLAEIDVLGHPVPESNFASALNRGLPQAVHL